MADIFTKVKVKYRGYNFEITPHIIRNKDGKVVELVIHKDAAISMIRQYVKFKYPKKPWKLWVRSQGGVGIDVFVSRKSGGMMNQEIFDDVQLFSESLKYDTNSELGTPLQMECKSIRVFNRPPFGKLEDVERVDTDDDSLEFKEKY